MTRPCDLTSRTILVLEDEPLIALDVEMALMDAGACVLGPVRDSPTAMDVIDRIVGNGSLSGAVLDVHLGSHTCEKVAAHLHDLDVPFVFYTGNLRDGDAFVRQLGAPVIRKPAPGHLLVSALYQIMQPRGA